MLRYLLRTTLIVSPSIWAVSALGANLTSPENQSITQPIASSSNLVASVIRPIPPVKLQPPKNNQTEHITILMVGDTGYAPSRANPLPKGVYKYGRWQTFEQTTRKIRHEINADINFANIETVISASTKLRPYPKKYNFVSHPNGIKHLVDIGFNLFSLANNHSFDYGQSGIRETLQHAKKLQKHGLVAFAGTGINRQQAANISVFSTKNTQVAFGAIGIGAGSGGIQRATQTRPGQLNLNNSGDVLLVTANLRNAPADLRLLSIHRGPERHIRPYNHEINSVRKIVRAGAADIMIGHHAHVARGMEIMDGRLIVYGLGNFLHQGTANMNGKNGCQNYSLIVKAHFVKETNQKPKLAAIEAMPINSTHMQTKRLAPKKAAKRIAILNGLANQFDNQQTNSKGVRFITQSDGTGLFCTNEAQIHAATRNLCSNFSMVHLASNNTYARATANCGRNAPTILIAKPNSNLQPKFVQQASIKLLRPSITSKFKPNPNSRPFAVPSDKLTTARILPQNPKYWPAGMPLAWEVPGDETRKQKLKRWAKKQYSIAEVERLLKKRGLL